MRVSTLSRLLDDKNETDIQGTCIKMQMHMIRSGHHCTILPSENPDVTAVVLLSCVFIFWKHWRKFRFGQLKILHWCCP